MLTFLTSFAVVLCLAGIVFLVLRMPKPDGTLEAGLRQLVAAELALAREEARASAADLRREVATAIRSGDESAILKLAELVRSVAQHGATQREDLERMRLQIQELSTANEARLDNVRKVVDERLQSIQTTVDEKLQETLEKRLGDSFTRVAAQLEEVHKGLGEMRGLASNVTDLKKVFSNVKSRGGWGEVQLESILVDILTPDQFERNAVVREDTRESVEFAVKFPGTGDTPLLLPVDAKFPREDYDDLVDAYDRGEPEAVEAAAQRLESTVKNAAKTIRDKYVNPPVTTDFAILFLPTEGLYAEVLRRAGLADCLQREHRVLIAGPTTLTAILTSLQMGFRTLAIEKRSSEVWRLLEAVKTEFGNFGSVVEKVDKTLSTARNHIDALRRRSRVLSKSLRNVDSLPETDAKLLLNLTPGSPMADEADDEAWVDATP